MRITSSRVVADMKQCIYMNKQRLLYTSVERNFQISQILVLFFDLLTRVFLDIASDGIAIGGDFK